MSAAPLVWASFGWASAIQPSSAHVLWRWRHPIKAVQYSRPSAAAMKLISTALDGTGAGPDGHQTGHRGPSDVERLSVDSGPK